MTSTEIGPHAHDLDRLRTTSTGQIADAMDELNIARSACSGRWAEVPRNRIVGTAFTVQFRAATSIGDFDEYIDEPAPGDVLILANDGRNDCAVWGGRRTQAALSRGLAGTLIDGAARDIEEHRAAGYGVLARDVSPLRSRGIVAPASTTQPVTFAGAVIRRGDVIVADASGVIVIPSEHAARVIDAAVRIAEFESSTQDALRAGARFDDVRRGDMSESARQGSGI